jgi:predicted transport protein
MSNAGARPSIDVSTGRAEAVYRACFPARLQLGHQTLQTTVGRNLRVGQSDKAKAHFIGSVVYIDAEDTAADIPRWILIDGQQRLTTLTLLLAALRDRIASTEPNGQPRNEEEGVPTRDALDDYYLCNKHGKDNRRYKLHLRRSDQETLASVLDGRDLPNPASEPIQGNLDYFRDQLADADLSVVYRGIKKLVAVDVRLTRGQDDPQMIFESLNSTGLDLTQADLIRNFVLMRHDEQTQTRLYQDYWQPIETAFGSRYRTDFDKFVRDYLTLELKPPKQFKADEIYHQFQHYYREVEGKTPIEEILARLKRFGGYYVAFTLGREQNPRLKDPFARLRLLVEVASVAILRLYDCYDRAKTLTLDEFIQAVELLESYVFRRSVGGLQTRSLGYIFSSIAYRIKSETPLVTLKVALHRQGISRRFPNDSEFRDFLETRDIYGLRQCKYLLDRLENDSKEKIDTASFSIEHVMPQNKELRPEWQAMLGPDWKVIQEKWLHRLGNITLTAYNPPYSDRPFTEKKTIENGFNDSPLRLNKYIRDQQSWTPVEMEQRGRDLAAKAVTIWPALVVDEAALRAAELEERRATAAKYSLDKLELDVESKAILDLLRPQIIGLGDDVIELCGLKSVTYRVHDFFVEVIPRARRLLLLLNLDFEECDDPTLRARDATEAAFIVNATESGGVLFSLENADQVAPAMHVVRQAYENVSE